MKYYRDIFGGTAVIVVKKSVPDSAVLVIHTSDGKTIRRCYPSAGAARSALDDFGFRWHRT